MTSLERFKWRCRNVNICQTMKCIEIYKYIRKLESDKEVKAVKYIKIAFQFAGLVITLLTTEKGRAALDGFLDVVEDSFIENDQVQKTCLKIRETILLPDDD